MDSIIFLTVALTVILIIFGTIIFAGYLIWRTGIIGKGIVLVASVWFVFEMYRAIFPFDDFYQREFVRVTGLKFPASGKILKKNASYPDFHGDYESCALIQVSELDYEALKISLQGADAKEGVRFSITCDWLSNRRQPVSDYLYFKHVEKAGGEIKDWGILKDSNLVYIEYSRW